MEIEEYDHQNCDETLSFYLFVRIRKLEYDEVRKNWIDKSDNDCDRITHESVYKSFKTGSKMRIIR